MALDPKTNPLGLDGIDFVEVRSEAELAGLAGSGSVLARVRVEREGNVDLHRRIAEAVAHALAT